MFPYPVAFNKASVPIPVLSYAPIALPSAAAPIAVLLLPVPPLDSKELRAPVPKAEFEFPSLFEERALYPKAALLDPPVLAVKAEYPKTELYPPVLAAKAEYPKTELVLIFPDPMPTLTPLINAFPPETVHLAPDVVVVPIPTFPDESIT